MQKKANILDFPKSGLSPEIWDENQNMKSDVKQFILDFISSFAQANNFKDINAWVNEIKCVGSLTTNLWNKNSDMDIHIGVDLSKFVATEHPEMSNKEASDYLDSIRKQVDQVKAKVPQTEHPVEIYFENEFTNKASQEFSGTYSILENKWVVEPHIVGKDFDIAILHPDLLNLAKETASELDAAFGEIKRDVQDIKELNETINEWPEEQRGLFENKLQKRLDNLESEIKDLVTLREDVAEKRKHYKALSEQEVRFKYLQKYFYMHVLTDLKTLLKQSPELTTKDIPVVENIMLQAQATPEEKHELDQVLMIDFDSTIAHENSDGTIGDPMKGVKEVLTDLKNQGYKIVIDSHRGNTQEGEDEIKEFMDKYEIPYDEIFQGEKPLAFRYIDDRAITFTDWNSVLKQVEKAKNKKEASLNSKYWIDPSGKEYSFASADSKIGGHYGWVAENILGIPANDSNMDKIEWETDKLITNGWTRVTSGFESSEGSDFAVEIANVHRVPSYLDNFIAKHFDPQGNGFEIDDAEGNYIKITDPFPSLQKAVNKALRQPVMASQVLSKKDAAFNPYQDESLKKGPAYAVYIGEQPGFEDLPAIKLYNIFGNSPRFGSTVTEQTLKELGIPIREQEKTAARAESTWITPSGEVIPVEMGNHASWVADNLDWLSSEYDSDFVLPYYEEAEIEEGDTERALFDIVLNLIAKDWTRVFQSNDAISYQIRDLSNPPKNAEDFFIQHIEGINDIEVGDLTGNNVRIQEPELGFVKGIQRGLQQKRLTTAQLGSDYDFSSTQFNLPKELSEKIIRWAVENIPEDQIVHDSKDPGTKGVQLESHITLKYGLKTNDFEEVKKVLEGEKAPHIKFGKTSFFEPEGKDYDVVIIPVESEDLQKLNKKLCSEVEYEETQFKEYHPHVTVAYVQKGFGKKYDGKDIITDEELDLDVLMFSPKEGEKRELELIKKDIENKAIFQDDHYWIEDTGNIIGPVYSHLQYLQENNLTEDKVFKKNWVRVFVFHSEIAITVKDINNIPSSVNDFITEKWNPNITEILITDIKGNKKSLELPTKPEQEKESSFMPSNTDLAPSNDWSGDIGWPGNEEMDPVWPRDDGENYYSPMDDRPREKSVWWKLLNMFKKQQPISKKDFVPMKEATIGKEAYYSHAYWLDPNGKIYPVRGEDEDAARRSLDLSNEDTHSGWILKHLDMLQKEYGIDPKSISGSTSELVKLGWTRIGDAYGTDWGIDVADTDNIPSFVDDAVAQFAPKGAMITVAGTSSTRYGPGGYTFEWPVKSIQQTVQQIKRARTNVQKQPVHAKQAFKQWATPQEPTDNPNMNWQWADSIYQYVYSNWQDLLAGWMNLDPKNYVKPVVVIEKIYEDEGSVSAWVYIEFVNTIGTTDAFMKLVISANIQGEESIEPEDREFSQYLTDWEIDVKDYGISDDLKKTSEQLVYIGKYDDADILVPEDLLNKYIATISQHYKGLSKQEAYEMDLERSYLHKQLINYVLKNTLSSGLDVKYDKDIMFSIDQLISDFAEEVAYKENYPGETEKESSYGPTNYQGPSVADHGYQNSAWDDMNVTYSPEEDEELMDQNGKGGFPNRWMSRHRGPYYTNEGKVIKMLEDTKPQKQASGPIQGWLAPDGKFYDTTKGTHDFWINNNHDLLLDKYAIDPRDLVNGPDSLILEGWVRVEGYIPSELDLQIADIRRPPQQLENFIWKSHPKVVILEDLFGKDIALDDFSKGLDQALRNPVASLKVNAAISGEVVNHILNLIHQNGDATWNMSKGNLVGQPYFAVAAYPEKEQIVDEADFENLEEYLIHNESLLNNPNNSFGAWVSNGKTYYDIVVTLTDKNQAMELGLKHKQLAIFNLQTLEEIPLQKVAKFAAVYSDREMQKEYDKVFSERWPEDSAPIDGGNEYYDWSELGSNDYPNPKDEEKEHVYMDLLDDPAKANFPAGLPEYWVTFYDAQPQGSDDGGI